MPAPSYHDIPIRSHCIVGSLTTAEPRTNRDVGYWIRSSLLKSGKAFSVMAGPAGGDIPGRNEGYAIAAAVAAMTEDECPPSLRPLRDAFIEATTKEGPAHGI